MGEGPTVARRLERDSWSTIAIIEGSASRERMMAKATTMTSEGVMMGPLMVGERRVATMIGEEDLC